MTYKLKAVCIINVRLISFIARVSFRLFPHFLVYSLDACSLFWYVRHRVVNHMSWRGGHASDSHRA